MKQHEDAFKSDIGVNCQLLADAALHESRGEAIKREEVLGGLDQVSNIYAQT